MTSLGLAAPLHLAAELSRAERTLLRAERSIRLIDRLIPLEFATERERLLCALTAGQAAEPRFRYAAAPEIARFAVELNLLAESLAQYPEPAHFYADRARELALEAELVVAIGSRRFVELAALRYRPERLHGKPEIDAWVDENLSASRAGQSTKYPETAEETQSTERIRTDDTRDPRSLYNLLLREVGASKWPIRVEVRRELWSVAAAGEGFVAIRAGALLTEREARRIVRHELMAHAVPRVLAVREGQGIFRVGARDAGEEEEGRALWLEEQGGYWDGARPRVLALRHHAASLVRAGATLNELVDSLAGLGAALPAALDLSLRVLRGGGLCRELMYVPAYLRVRAEFQRDPRVENVFQRGRASIAFARWLLG
ncbi:MAG TPA: tyrosine/phenylalanine carboxypeptidase domain-containing protein [Polyangiaceae bacterium]|nr:tyrosine/phenylalanine carboxypeptidase domain-containing protein [Polyangiaceae bacterium]